MLLDDHIRQKTLAHAYFITGIAKPYLETLFRPESFEVIMHTEKTGIDEVRNILKRVSLASIPDKRQVVILNADLLGREAKSALLKILEEPPPYTHFILYGTSKKTLTPAIASRLLDGGKIVYEEPEDQKKRVAVFLKAGNDPKKREAALKDIADTASLALFLHALENTVRKEAQAERATTQERIHIARTLLSHPVPVVSSIKDYISLLL